MAISKSNNSESRSIKSKRNSKKTKRTFFSFILIFILIGGIGVLMSCFSMTKYEMDAVRQSVSEQKSIKIDDLKVSLNTYPGGDEVVETLDNNKLNQKFLDLIQKSSADEKKVVKISKDLLSLNQARILLNALQKKKISNVATSAKNKTQSLIFKIVGTMFIVIFLASLLFLYNTTLVMDEVNAITFIGTTIKEIISFLFFSIGLYTVINSLFVGDNISTVASLSKSMTFLYAWMPVNIILLAGMSIFNIYSKTNE